MSKNSNKNTGWPGNCTEEQLKALQDFRVFVKTLNNGELRPEWDDYYLLRFLRARKFHKQETEKMWRNFIEWRKSNNIDESKTFHLPEIIQLRKEYPHGYHKVDKLGRPIYIERVGCLNVDKVFKFTNEERLLKYYALSYETLLTTIFDACTQFRNKNTGEKGKIQQTCTILDLKNVKLTSASKAYNFVKPASAMAQDNYPEILGNMFIINAPMLFTAVWAVVKVWIDEKTKQKIKILGSSYKKQLLNYIDPENLPSFIDGGTCKCQGNGGDCLSWNIGPWNPEGKQIFISNLQPQSTEPSVSQKQEEKEEKQVEQKIAEMKIQNPPENQTQVAEKKE